MSYGHSVKMELIDGSNVWAWEDSDPSVSSARFIDYSVAHSGKLSPNAYLKLYVDGAPEYQKLIRDKKVFSFKPSGGLTRMDGSGVDNPVVRLDKKTASGYCVMIGMSYTTSGGEYLSDSDLHMVAYFDGSGRAVYNGFIPFVRVINTNTEPVYVQAALVTNQ
jgi:hypothetical protein